VQRKHAQPNHRHQPQAEKQHQEEDDDAAHDDARCERQNLAEKPKREQLQQDDEKRAQHDKQCELSQVHGDAT
jgi:hypothetical protein